MSTSETLSIPSPVTTTPPDTTCPTPTPMESRTSISQSTDCTKQGETTPSKAGHVETKLQEGENRDVNDESNIQKSPGEIRVHETDTSGWQLESHPIVLWPDQPTSNSLSSSPSSSSSTCLKREQSIDESLDSISNSELKTKILLEAPTKWLHGVDINERYSKDALVELYLAVLINNRSRFELHLDQGVAVDTSTSIDDAIRSKSTESSDNISVSPSPSNKTSSSPAPNPLHDEQTASASSTPSIDSTKTEGELDSPSNLSVPDTPSSVSKYTSEGVLAEQRIISSPTVTKCLTTHSPSREGVASINQNLPNRFDTIDSDGWKSTVRRSKRSGEGKGAVSMKTMTTVNTVTTTTNAFQIGIGSDLDSSSASESNIKTTKRRRRRKKKSSAVDASRNNVVSQVETSDDITAAAISSQKIGLAVKTTAQRPKLTSPPHSNSKRRRKKNAKKRAVKKTNSYTTLDEIPQKSNGSTSRSLKVIVFAVALGVLVIATIVALNTLK